MRGNRYRVILYRSRNRYVKEWPARSKYAAKQLVKEKEDEYDHSYRLEIRKS